MDNIQTHATHTHNQESHKQTHATHTHNQESHKQTHATHTHNHATHIPNHFINWEGYINTEDGHAFCVGECEWSVYKEGDNE